MSTSNDGGQETGGQGSNVGIGSTTSSPMVQLPVAMTARNMGPTTQMSTRAFNSPCTTQSTNPVISHINSGEPFQQTIAQPMPAQIFATGNPSGQVAVPLSTNLLHLAGGVAQGPFFATQLQPVFIGGQPAAMVSTVQSPISAQQNHIQLLARPGTQMPNLSPSLPGSNMNMIGTVGPRLQAPLLGNGIHSPGLPDHRASEGILGPGNIPVGIPTGVFIGQAGNVRNMQASVPYLSPGIPAPRVCSSKFPVQDSEMPTDLSKKSTVDSEKKLKEATFSTVSELDSKSNGDTKKSLDNAIKMEEMDVTAGNKQIKEEMLDKKKFSGIDTGDYNEDGVPIEYEEPEFVWEEYLEETGSTAVPPTAFKHVEYSLESGFVKGMKLEVPNKCNMGTYWVTSVIMTCGPLLRLRYDGYEEDTSADFWCDLMTSEIHPIGWCAQNNQILQPPEAINDKFDDWREFLVRSLTGARTAPSYLLDKTTGITPIDQLKQGMRLELQHPINPLDVWLVKIIENVGGRLYLRFEGAESASHDFWLFYLNHRLHPVGWAKSNGYRYNPPPELCSTHDDNNWMQILDLALAESDKMVLPIAIFKDQEEIKSHAFREGWKLEALNPLSHNQICPATVIKILDSKYFVVEIDDLDRSENSYPIRFSCHSESRVIFPCHWCQKKGIRISAPRGWHKSDFSWTEYLAHSGRGPAPESCFNISNSDHEFDKGMKLEAVNPENPNQICAATITKIVDPLIWVHLDNSTKMVASHIEHIDSHNVFPVGWCESNGYQLKQPRKTGIRKGTPKSVAFGKPQSSNKTDEAYTQIRHEQTQGNLWCPKIYYNHKCFSGPYLSKGRIASLPKCVGPGPITLVMKEVLSNLINVAYKSCRVLRELQMEAKPNPNMHQQTIKAKYKGKSYRATVEICKDTEQLVEFCRQVCIKLECCPNLISPHHVDDNCPDNCSQLTKTKYTYYYGKKKYKKLGRPPGGHSNLENGPKKPGKRGRKKKKFKLMEQNENTNQAEDAGEEESDRGEEDKESVASDTKTADSSGTNESNEVEIKTNKYAYKRKYTHHLPPPSDIQTRGAKLPKYSFERKTHKKILISHAQNSSVMGTKDNVEMLATKPHEKQKVEQVSRRKEYLYLTSNPLKWSVSDVIKFIKTTDCANLARLFKEQAIDGQALLLLSLPTVQEYLDLKLGPAIKLCHQIEQVKIAFYDQYAK